MLARSCFVPVSDMQISHKQMHARVLHLLVRHAWLRASKTVQRRRIYCYMPSTPPQVSTADGWECNQNLCPWDILCGLALAFSCMISAFLRLFCSLIFWIRLWHSCLCRKCICMVIYDMINKCKFCIYNNEHRHNSESSLTLSPRTPSRTQKSSS